MISVGSVLFPPNYLENKLVITFIGVKNTNSAIIQTPSSNFVLYGSLEDIYYNIKSSQIKKNSRIPLIILDDIKEFKFLYELVDLYKIENIIMPSKYAENYPDLFNIKYVDTNIRSSFDHIDVKINAEGWGIEEVSFKFCDSIVSFSNDNQYITNNILNSNENKTVIINSKYKTKEFDKISKSDFSGNNKLYSKKYYNDKIRAYTNFSMIEITDKGIEFFK
jgi:hypothetical protein